MIAAAYLQQMQLLDILACLCVNRCVDQVRSCRPAWHVPYVDPACAFEELLSCWQTISAVKL